MKYYKHKTSPEYYRVNDDGSWDWYHYEDKANLHDEFITKLSNKWLHGDHAWDEHPYPVEEISELELTKQLFIWSL